MIRKTLFAAILLTLLGASVYAQKGDAAAEEKVPENYDSELAKKLGADDYGMKSYVYVLLKTGPAKITDTEKRSKLFRGHFSNMGRLAEAGKLVMAGPFDDPNGVMRGMFIFNVKTVEEAKRLVETDPAVEAGIFEYEMTKLYGSAALMMINDIHKKLARKGVN